MARALDVSDSVFYYFIAFVGFAIVFIKRAHDQCSRTAPKKKAGPQLAIIRENVGDTEPRSIT